MQTSGSRGRRWPSGQRGGEDWVLECAVSVVERWMGHRAVRGVVGGLLVGREGAVGVGRGRDADQRLQRHGVAQRATGGEEWVLECAVSVVERWMGHRAVRGVVGGLLVGREGAVGVGRGRFRFRLHQLPASLGGVLHGCCSEGPPSRVLYVRGVFPRLKALCV